MKKIILILVIALSGCAVAARHELNQYVAENKSMAETGAIKWSDYYKGLFDKLSQMSNQKGAGEAMQMVNHMIDTSLAYESGQITKEKFESIQREAKSIAAQREAADSAARAAAMGQALQNYGATAYRPIPPATMPINCTTTHMPGLVASTTTCN